jgi:hypothetical protein
MAHANQLFFLGLMSALLGGCASFTQLEAEIPRAQATKSDGGTTAATPDSTSIPTTAKR